jgi:hypothetical protein
MSSPLPTIGSALGDGVDAPTARVGISVAADADSVGAQQAGGRQSRVTRCTRGIQVAARSGATAVTAKPLRKVVLRDGHFPCNVGRPWPEVPLVSGIP